MNLRFTQNYGKYRPGQVCEVFEIVGNTVLFKVNDDIDIVRIVDGKLLRPDNGEEYGVIE
jgi:hypothetical protein